MSDVKLADEAARILGNIAYLLGAGTFKGELAEPLLEAQRYVNTMLTQVKGDQDGGTHGEAEKAG